jgi:tetratricopeptide (TPR) repeat protein
MRALKLPRCALLFGLGLIALGCAKAPPLPADLSAAQQAEREPSPAPALAAYQVIVDGCLKSPRHEPKDPCGTAALRRGQALEQLGRNEEAAAAYLQVRTVSTDGRTIARALFRAASLFAGPLGQPAEALRLCRELIPRWPDEVAAEDALKLLHDLLLETADPGLLEELFRLGESLREHEVVGSFALLYRARLLEEKRQNAAALAVYDTLWSRFPRGPLFDDALMAAAQLLRKERRPAEAAARLERLEASFTGSIIVGHYNKLLLDEGAVLLGEIYLHDLGQPERAIAALSGLLKRQRTSLLCDDALYLMAEAALRRHTPSSASDRDEACRYLARLRREYPDGNRVRRATELQSRLGCLSGA